MFHLFHLFRENNLKGHYAVPWSIPRFLWMILELIFCIRLFYRRWILTYWDLTVRQVLMQSRLSPKYYSFHSKIVFSADSGYPSFKNWDDFTKSIHYGEFASIECHIRNINGSSTKCTTNLITVNRISSRPAANLFLSLCVINSCS